MNQKNLHAARKIREAMLGLKAAFKTASTEEKRVIASCMHDLRDIRADIISAAEAEEEVEEEEVDEEEEPADEEVEEEVEEEEVDEEEEPADEEVEEEEVDEEEVDEEEEPADEEEVEEEEVEAAFDDGLDDEFALEEDDSLDDNLALSLGDEEDDGLLDLSEDEDMDVLSDSDEDLAYQALDLAASALSAMEEGEAEEAEEEPAEEEVDEEAEEEEMEEEEAPLTDEEIASLEAAGLLEGSSIEDRIAEVEARVGALVERRSNSEDDYTPSIRELRWLRRNGVALSAEYFLAAGADDHVLSAVKKMRITKAQRKEGERKWKGAKTIGRSAPKKNARGNWYVTIYRKKGTETGHYNKWISGPKLTMKKVPEGASAAVKQQIAEHNKISKMKVLPPKDKGKKKTAKKKKSTAKKK